MLSGYADRCLCRWHAILHGTVDRRAADHPAGNADVGSSVGHCGGVCLRKWRLGCLHDGGAWNTAFRGAAADE